MAKKTSGVGDGGYITAQVRTPGAPYLVAQGSDRVTIKLNTNSNGPNTTWAIEVEEDSSGINFLKATPDINDMSGTKVWQLAATWDTGSGIIVVNLDNTKAYRFRAYVRPEGDTGGGTVGPWSAVMASQLNIDWSSWSNTDSYEVTTGNTKVSDLTFAGSSRAIRLTYTLINKTSETSSIVANFKATSDGTFAVATALTISAGDYAIVSDNGAGKGTITNNGVAGTAPFYQLEAGDKITLSSSEDAGNNGVHTIDTVTSQIITLTSTLTTTNANDTAMVITGGEGLSSLTSSLAGVEHQFIWDTGTDLGNSFNASTVEVEIIPSDSDGDAGTSATLDSQTVNNVPLAPTTLTEIKEYTFDKQDNPAIVAEMNKIVLGATLYFQIEFTTGSTVTTFTSQASAEGWRYETDRDSSPGSEDYGNDTNWTQMLISGVSIQYAPPEYSDRNNDTRNRVRFVLPAINNLTAGSTYAVKMRQGEVNAVV